MLFESAGDNVEDIYNKYMQFNQVMLEDYSAMEIASILIVQGLTFYRSIMSEEDYQKIIESIYQKRNQVQRLK